jgi:shikimate dehydrogenase
VTQGKQFVLIGHPVGHSVSPAIHRAAYGALGLPHTYEAVDCPTAEDAKRQIARVRAGVLAGANITVPHKRVALAEATQLDESARKVGAANVLLCNTEGQLVAHNTDALALTDELGTAAPGRSALVIGNGGAALAAVVACQAAGAQRVFVVARRFIANVPCERWPMAAELQARGASLLPWPSGSAQPLREMAASCVFVVQATSAGMQGADSGEAIAQVVPWDALPRDTLVYDLVYNPARTPIIERALQLGLPAKNGLGMLVGQAAHAFTLWLGRPAPVSAMREAAEAALFGASP